MPAPCPLTPAPCLLSPALLLGWLVLCAGAWFGWAAEVTVVGDSAQLRQAMGAAKAGSVIRLLPGEYRGELHYAGKAGTAGAPIVITGAIAEAPPVIRGGGEGIKLSSVAHIELSHLVIEGAGSNGINIDDGERDEPSHHVTLRNVLVRNGGGRPGDCGIKLTGVDNFLLQQCVVERCGKEAASLTFIGCHDGRVLDCLVDGRDYAGVGLQMKGGSSDIRVARCVFRGVVGRSVQIGGSTGLKFFRPHISRFEARDIVVEDCSILGSEASVAFVGSSAAVVRNNAIYCPTGWVVRILQENRMVHMEPCQHGRFVGNVVAWENAALTRFVDVRKDTAPWTFVFEQNYWYCLDRPSRSRPVGLPTREIGGVYGEDPKFVSPETGDLQLGRSREQMRAAYAEGEAQRRRYEWSCVAVVSLALAIAGAVLFSRRLLAPARSGVYSIAFKYAPPAPPRRAHFAATLVAWAAALTYAQIVNAGGFGIAVQGGDDLSASAVIVTDVLYGWATVNQLVAFLPVGLCAAAAGMLDRPGRQNLIQTAAALAAGCVVWLAGVRMLGLGDGPPALAVVQVLVGLGGGLLGFGIWIKWGQPAVDRLRRYTASARTEGWLDAVLGLYTLGLAVYWLLPLDVTVEPKELYFKWTSGLVRLIPFAARDFRPAWDVLAALAFVPVGAWAATVWTSKERPIRASLEACLIGLTLAIAIEAARFVVREGACDATRVVLAAAGVLAGAIGVRLVGKGWFKG